LLNPTVITLNAGANTIRNGVVPDFFAVKRRCMYGTEHRQGSCVCSRLFYFAPKRPQIPMCGCGIRLKRTHFTRRHGFEQRIIHSRMHEQNNEEQHVVSGQLPADIYGFF